MEVIMKDAIEKRRSVRTYADRPLDQKDEAFVSRILKDALTMKTPFSHTIDLFYYRNQKGEEPKTRRIGTYGFVQDAPAFIGGTTKPTKEGLIDFGYLFEYVILKLTERGLGTVWLGGTFRRKTFDDHMKEDRIVPAISAVGYEASYRTLREKTLIKCVKATKRKPFEELFFDRDFSQPLKETDSHPLIPYLKLVQAGPSASNKQPWRIVVKEGVADIYLKRTANYANVIPFDIQWLDLGIAICHLETGLSADGILFRRFVDEAIADDEMHEYAISIELQP
jgi:nitroreductase